MDKQEKWFSLIREYEQGSEAQRKFCQIRDLKFSTFGYWRKKYIRSQLPEQTDLSEKGVFLPIETSTDCLEVIYPNGVRLQLPSGTAATRLSALIRLY